MQMKYFLGTICALCFVRSGSAQAGPPSPPVPSYQPIPAGLTTYALLDFGNYSVTKYGAACDYPYLENSSFVCSTYHLLECYPNSKCECVSGATTKEVYPGRITCGYPIGHHCNLSIEDITRGYYDYRNDPTHPIKFNLKLGIKEDVESDRYTPHHYLQLLTIQELIDSTNGARVLEGLSQYSYFVPNSLCLSFNCSADSVCVGHNEEPPIDPNEPELKLSLGAKITHTTLFPLIVITILFSIYL